MASLIDSQSLQITCGGCGNDFAQTVGDAKRDGHTTCPSCGRKAELDQAALEAIAAAEQEVLDLQAKAGEIFKGLFKGGRK